MIREHGSRRTCVGCVETIYRRMRSRWGPESVEFYLTDDELRAASDRIRVGFKHLTFGAVVPFMKLCLNAWPTARRYGLEPQKCWAGCGEEDGDSTEHYLLCKRCYECQIKHFSSVLPGYFLVSTLKEMTAGSLLGLSFNMPEEEDEDGISAFILHWAVFFFCY